jgi:hypothetical protein
MAGTLSTHAAAAIARLIRVFFIKGSSMLLGVRRRGHESRSPGRMKNFFFDY